MAKSTKVRLSEATIDTSLATTDDNGEAQRTEAFPTDDRYEQVKRGDIHIDFGAGHVQASRQFQFRRQLPTRWP